MTYRVPIATWRLQFHGEFGFQAARRIVPYLAELGISDIYSSPLLRPRTGSQHGYDIVDAMALNPQLGTMDDFTELQGELDAHDMGLLLDIVPNHMAASHENAWWMSVLENGMQSRYMHYFDIDWTDNKVLLPILGKPYGDALEGGELQLGFDESGFFVAYWDKRMPLAPQSYPLVLRECLDALPNEGPAIEIRDLVQNETVIANSKFLKETLWRVHEQSEAFRDALTDAIARLNADHDLLDGILAVQNYRLAYWRIASETINYRRFFDVTDLIGVRVENPEVFEMRNRLILDLIADGKVTGVRIDHIDGLFEPVNYLTRMQLRLGDPETEEREQFYVVVEKILEHGEELPESFRCAGTTGYDFLDTVNTLLLDPAGLEALTAAYTSYTGNDHSWEELVYERKKQVIDHLFYGEMRALGGHLGRLAVADRNARDFSPSELIAALVEITACLPVYRTYVREGEISEADRQYIDAAIAQARSRAPWVDRRILNFIEVVLRLEPPKYIEAERPRWLEFVMRWQQFTGRVMAKGVEDTAFYNFNRLISMNEVGGEPGRKGRFDPVEELHARNRHVAAHWPHTMNATSTHDTKRSEDVRARLQVLSEMPDAWYREVRRWTRANTHLRRDGVPHPNEEWMLYQTLVGMWPLDEAERADVPDRLRLFLQKAAREAKTHSSWLEPNVAYEEALQDFAVAILDNPEFMGSFERFQKRIAFHGFLNSLTQVVLKVCSPGVPDFYQGTDAWDFSLVDPDNRRPIDYDRRIRMLQPSASPRMLLRRWRDGAIKAFVTKRSLEVRRRRLDLFADGSYRAIETGTPHAVAFTRGEDDVLVVVPRLTSQLVRAPRLPLGEVWGDAAIAIGGSWQNAFTGEAISGESLRLRDVFAAFPVAILEKPTTEGAA